MHGLWQSRRASSSQPSSTWFRPFKYSNHQFLSPIFLTIYIPCLCLCMWQVRVCYPPFPLLCKCSTNLSCFIQTLDNIFTDGSDILQGHCSFQCLSTPTAFDMLVHVPCGLGITLIEVSADTVLASDGSTPEDVTSMAIFICDLRYRVEESINRWCPLFLQSF